jgi:hypothetical protein
LHIHTIFVSRIFWHFKVCFSSQSRITGGSATFWAPPLLCSNVSTPIHIDWACNNKMHLLTIKQWWLVNHYDMIIDINIKYKSTEWRNYHDDSCIFTIQIFTITSQIIRPVQCYALVLFYFTPHWFSLWQKDASSHN